MDDDIEVRRQDFFLILYPDDQSPKEEYRAYARLLRFNKFLFFNSLIFRSDFFQYSSSGRSLLKEKMSNAFYRIFTW